MMTDYEKKIYQTSEEAFPLHITSDNPNFHNGIGRFSIDKECEANKVKNKNVKHYDLWDGFEAIDIMKIVLSREEYIGYLKGNILKYQLRLSKKDDVQKEVQKILDYTNELNEILRG